MGIPAGVELNRGSTQGSCGVDGSWDWIDEEADPDTASPRRKMAWRSRVVDACKSSPPSVVTSSRRSGTEVA